MLKPKKTKVCTKCLKRKKVEYFYPVKTTKDGLRARCKRCTNDESLKYFNENRKKIAAYKRAYFASAEGKEKVRQYRDKIKERLAKYWKLYAKENKDKISKYQRKYRQKNKDKLNAYHNDYYHNVIKPKRQRERENDQGM